MADTNWTDEELRAALIAYREIKDADASGRRVSPTSEFRKLKQGPLSARSEGAIGRRMSNISWVFLGEGLPIAARFKGSLGHVGAEVARRILALNAELDGPAEEPTAKLVELKTRVRRLRGRRGALPIGAERPAQSTVATVAYLRDPAVAAHVLDRACGKCEACGSMGPFLAGDGEPFLEVHHVVQLAEGGPDTIDNAIAACPNCHRRLHHSIERAAFRKSVVERCKFLRKWILADRLEPGDSARP